MSNLSDLLADFPSRTALILGSGLSGLADSVDITTRVDYSTIDGFKSGTVSGHSGELILGKISNYPVIILSGRRHYYEDGESDAMREPIRLLSECGIKNIIITNAAGSLDTSMPVGSLMQIEDHINFSGTNPLLGESDERRFVGMSKAYDEDLLNHFSTHARELDLDIFRGVYMWFSGPSFETPAEIRMARTMGADAVGMSSVPEVILSRFYGLRVSAFSVITNLGAGMQIGELSHTETKEMAPQGGEMLIRLLIKALGHGLPS